MHFPQDKSLALLSPSSDFSLPIAPFSPFGEILIPFLSLSLAASTYFLSLRAWERIGLWQQLLLLLLHGNSDSSESRDVPSACSYQQSAGKPIQSFAPLSPIGQWQLLVRKAEWQNGGRLREWAHITYLALFCTTEFPCSPMFWLLVILLIVQGLQFCPQICLFSSHWPQCVFHTCSQNLGDYSGCANYLKILQQEAPDDTVSLNFFL